VGCFFSGMCRCSICVPSFDLWSSSLALFCGYMYDMNAYDASVFCSFLICGMQFSTASGSVMLYFLHCVVLLYVSCGHNLWMELWSKSVHRTVVGLVIFPCQYKYRVLFYLIPVASCCLLNPFNIWYKDNPGEI
jgi:hypothetical protein